MELHGEEWYIPGASVTMAVRGQMRTMNMTKIAAVAMAGMVTATGLAAADKISKIDERLSSANIVLGEMMRADDKGVPQQLLNSAECVVVVPGVKKGGFIVGGKYGKGFVACHKPSGTGWTAPAAMIVEGGSVGFQIGASETDVILIIQNESGMKKIEQDKFTIGADASVAGGPVGRDLSAETDAQMHAEILSYSRSRGLFAGLALTGATLRPDTEDNETLYGPGTTLRKILSGEVSPTPAAAPLESRLDKYAVRKAN